MEPQSGTKIWQRDSIILFVICLLALSVRVYRLMTWTSVIENEGSDYVRLATNLLHYKSYIGMDGLPELSFAPLYSVLIAAAIPFTKTPELAGRIVSVLSGCLMVLPMYFLARQLYGRKTAIICAALTAFYPVLVAYSTGVYNETLYLALLAAGECSAVFLLRLTTLRWAALTGLFFGLAYLTRPEAVGFPILVLLGLFLLAFARKGIFKNAIRALAVLLLTFSLVAAPYVAYLYFHTGRISFQTKAKLNYTIGVRFSQGMPYDEASAGIRDDLKVEGPFLDPIRYATYTPYPWTFTALIRYFLTRARVNLPKVESLLSEPGFGMILLGLVVLGLFREQWDDSLSVANLFLITNLLFVLFVILQVHLMQFRYLMPIYPFLLLWASRGLTQLSEWTKGTFKSVAAPGGTVAARLLQYGVMVLLLVSNVRGVMWNSEIQEGGAQSAGAKIAGTWLGQHFPPGTTVMTAGDSTVAFYANATLTFLPYTESAVALRYIQSKNPSLIVMNSMELQKRPYLGDWLEHGIPDPHAKLVYDSLGPVNTRVAIYQWQSQLTRTAN